jgi:hypothetical protein
MWPTINKPGRRRSYVKKRLSHETSTQKRELDNSSKPNWIKGKRQPAREITPPLRKSYSLLLLVMFADGRRWSRWRWWWVRTSQARHKSMWQRFGVKRVKRQKASLNRKPSAYICGWGSVSHQTPVMWYGRGWSTQHSWWVIRPTRHTARNFKFYRWTVVCT